MRPFESRTLSARVHLGADIFKPPTSRAKAAEAKALKARAKRDAAKAGANAATLEGRDECGKPAKAPLLKRLPSEAKQRDHGAAEGRNPRKARRARTVRSGKPNHAPEPSLAPPSHRASKSPAGLSR